MFTGIVEAVGQIQAATEVADGRRLAIAADKVLDGMAVGDSIAVNGVCLTAVVVEPGRVSVVAVGETLSRSALGRLGESDLVNLERPMAATGRFDGHIVQGHVDGVATVAAITPEEDARRLRFGAEPALLKYIVEKGSVAVDGVSLTVTAVDSEAFEVVLIPHTLEATILGDVSIDDPVNIEVDILAKYVERLLEDRP